LNENFALPFDVVSNLNRNLDQAVILEIQSQLAPSGHGHPGL
jgi:hypothetical protein